MVIKKKNKLKIIDTTLRNAQQSSCFKHIDEKELISLFRDLDKCGFEALDIMGGESFLDCLRVWHKDPWTLIKKAKKHIKNTPLQMNIRGKYLVGYKPYSDEIIKNFIKTATDHGISHIRIFDPLNDINNIKNSINFSKKYGAHVQGTLCYSKSKYYDTKFFVNYAKKLKDAGVDSILIKDPVGILLPDDAVKLIKKIKKETTLPVRLHTHLINGAVNVTYYEAIKAGVDSVDTTLGDFSFPVGQPSLENILRIFKDSTYDIDLDIKNVNEISEKISKLYMTKPIEKTYFPFNDQTILNYELTPGSLNFVYKQLEKRNALDKLPEVLDEISKVRKELGSPPLFIPISQLIIAQSIYNILMDARYKLIPNEIKDFIKGVYGKPPAKILLDKSQKENTLELQDKKVTSTLKNIHEHIDPDLIKNDSDYITYALFPELALDFFNWRKNPKKHEFTQGSQEKKVTAEEEVLVLDKLMQEKNVTEFELNEKDHYISIKKFAAESNGGTYTYMPPTTGQAPIPKASAPKPAATKETKPKETINSPIVGVFYSKPNPDSNSYVKPGDIVQEGDTLCIIEAMKVMNEIKAPYACKITNTLLKDKDSVEPNQALFEIIKN